MKYTKDMKKIMRLWTRCVKFNNLLNRIIHSIKSKLFPRYIHLEIDTLNGKKKYIIKNPEFISICNQSNNSKKDMENRIMNIDVKIKFDSTIEVDNDL
jgi:hypothetical protein